MDAEENVVPPVKFLEPYRFEPKRRFLESVRERSSNDAVHGQSTSGTSSSIREEEREPERITGFDSRIGTTNWCTCESCGPMRREVDCLCCHESAGALAMSDGLRCITLHGDFSSICLNPVVLRVCLIGYQELWNNTDPMTNR